MSARVSSALLGWSCRKSDIPLAELIRAWSDRADSLIRGPRCIPTRTGAFSCRPNAEGPSARFFSRGSMGFNKRRMEGERAAKAAREAEAPALILIAPRRSLVRLD